MTALRVAARCCPSEVEGPGRRWVLWVQGCSLSCPGCCNPEFLLPGGGTRIDVAELIAELDLARARDGIEGITILGGEPLEQLAPLGALLHAATARGLGVVLFTGYRLEEARCLPGFAELWGLVDTLVDGRFEAARPDRGRGVIGSTNQRLHHRTGRYATSPYWSSTPAAEVHVASDGTLRFVGAPALAGRARGLLRRPGARGSG